MILRTQSYPGLAWQIGCYILRYILLAGQESGWMGKVICNGKLVLTSSPTPWSPVGPSQIYTSYFVHVDLRLKGVCCIQNRASDLMGTTASLPLVWLNLCPNLPPPQPYLCQWLVCCLPLLGLTSYHAITVSHTLSEHLQQWQPV